MIALAPNRAHAAVDYILNTNGAVHCNNTSHAEPGFAVQSFSLGGTSLTAVIGNGGSGVGKIALSDFTITKSFDSCSEQLITAFLSGSTIRSLTLTGYSTTADSNGAHTAILVITLDLAAISSYQLSGSNVLPEESLSFSYRVLCVTSTPLRSDGSSSGDTTHVCYDRQKNIVTH